MTGKVFSHGGDMGDVIYSLPTVRALGGGTLYLCPIPITRMPFTEENTEGLLSLLRAQPYIEHAEFCENPEHVNYNLDLFRQQPYGNLADCHLQPWGLPLDEKDSRWLTAPNPTKTTRIVVNFTARYRTDFPWETVVKNYGSGITFIGSAPEHVAFCALFGEVAYRATPTLLDVANVIEGCDLFIGSQSMPAAIAEGLKHNSIQAVWGRTNIFNRPNLISVGHINLPSNIHEVLCRSIDSFLAASSAISLSV